MAKKSKKGKKKPKIARKTAKRKVNKQKKRGKRSNMTKKKGSSRRSKAKNFMSGTPGKIILGTAAGLASSFLVSKAPGNIKAYADDAGDLVSTMVAGKTGLVANLVAKRIAAPIINTLTGGNQPTGGAGLSGAA